MVSGRASGKQAPKERRADSSVRDRARALEAVCSECPTTSWLLAESSALIRIAGPFCVSAAGGMHFIQGIELTQMRGGRGQPKEMTVDVLPSSLPYDTPHLNRVLSWWSLTSMGVGATIGAGIFVMTGEASALVAAHRSQRARSTRACAALTSLSIVCAQESLREK